MPQQKPKKAPRFYKSKKWNDVCLSFLASMRAAKRSPLTISYYTNILRAFFAFLNEKHGEERTLDRVLPSDVEEFIVRRGQGQKRGNDKPLSAYTTNVYLAIIKSFFDYCARKRMKYRGKMVPILAGPLPTEGLPALKTGDVERDMTEAEVRAFFRSIDQSTSRGKRNYALFWALFVTGKRRTEISRLRRSDLEPFQFDHGPGWLYHYKAKGRATKDSAEMPADAMDAIIAFHQAERRDFATMPPETALFPGERTDSPICPDYLSRIFRRYAQMAGMADNLVTHSLRWENAYQRWLACDKDLLKVQQEMGWASIEQAAHYIRRRHRKNAGDRTAASIAAKFR